MSLLAFFLVSLAIKLSRGEFSEKQLDGTWASAQTPGALAFLEVTNVANGFVLTPTQPFENVWIAGAGRFSTPTTGDVNFVHWDGSMKQLSYNISSSQIGPLMTFSNGKQWYKVRPFTSLDFHRDIAAYTVQMMLEWFPEEEADLLANQEIIIENIMTNGTKTNGSAMLFFSQVKDVKMVDQVEYSQCDVAIANVLSDAFSFVMGFVGLRGFSKSLVSGAILKGMSVRAFSQEVKALASASGASKKAKALFGLMKAFHKAGGFKLAFRAIKGTIKNMSWWQWTKTIGIATAQLASWFASDGLAFVAEVAATILKAAGLITDAVKASRVC